MNESVRAELSAVGESLDGYRSRVASLVERTVPGSEDLVSAIYEAERALLTAHRLVLRAEKLAR